MILMLLMVFSIPLVTSAEENTKDCNHLSYTNYDKTEVILEDKTCDKHKYGSKEFVGYEYDDCTLPGGREVYQQIYSVCGHVKYSYGPWYWI